jgi:hypothetical protein
MQPLLQGLLQAKHWHLVCCAADCCMVAVSQLV